MWVALRPSEIEPSRYENYAREALAYKEKIIREGFHLPDLSYNMRNSSSVIQGLDCLYAGDNQSKALDVKENTKEMVKLTVPRAPLPPNTVPGSPPVVIPISQEMHKFVLGKVVAGC